MIGIKAIGTYLPDVRTSNFDRMDKFGMTASFVRDKIGFTQSVGKFAGKGSDFY
jgi:hypothetical protein